MPYHVVPCMWLKDSMKEINHLLRVLFIYLIFFVLLLFFTFTSNSALNASRYRHWRRSLFISFSRSSSFEFSFSFHSFSYFFVSFFFSSLCCTVCFFLLFHSFLLHSRHTIDMPAYSTVVYFIVYSMYLIYYFMRYITKS